MTDVDTTLAHEEGEDQEDQEASLSDALPAAGILDPFRAPPEVAPSVTFVAEQQHRRCYTIDTTQQAVLFRLAARMPDVPPGARGRFRLNLAIVVDRSGSMEERYLEQAKRACAAMLDMAGPDDYISVIAVAEKAELILPARRVVDKAAAKASINRIAAGNTTNLQQGLLVAYQQLAAVMNASTLDRLILVTDGDPAAGSKDYSTIVSQVAEQKARGISLTAFGLGLDYSEELLAGLAHRTGGNFYHVPNAERLAELFGLEFQAAAGVVARNVRLRVHLTNGASVRQVYGHHPTYGNRVVEVQLCDIAGGSGLESLWEFELSTRQPGRYRVAYADVRYDDFNTGRPERLTADIVYEFASESIADTGPEVAQFDAEIEVAEAVRTVDKTLLAVRRQNLDPVLVLQELAQVQSVLEKYGRKQKMALVAEASAQIRAGGATAKTLMSAVFQLDQGKAH
jgi:Ca-activated chloride channel family protein